MTLFDAARSRRGRRGAVVARPADRRLRRRRRSTASPRNAGRARRSAARCAAALERVLRPPGRADRAPAAPTPGCTPGARSSASTPPADGARPRRRCSGRSTSCCGPADRRPRRRRWPADDFDARFSATARALPLHGAQPARARPVPGRTAWHVDRAARPARACGWPATRSSASTTSPRSAGGPRRRDGAEASLRAAGARRRLGRRSATACCGSRSRPRRSATRWCAAIVGHAGRGRLGASGPASMAIDPAARDRDAAGQLAPPHGLCLWQVATDATARGPRPQCADESEAPGRIEPRARRRENVMASRGTTRAR